jgi:sulfite reductase (NADPH) flavoprotein alpha-component
MLRRIHSLPGLLLALLLAVVAGTGTVLSIDTALDRATLPTIKRGTNVAALAEAVTARHGSVDKIVRRPTGAVTITYSDGDINGVELVDPATGAGLGPYRTSKFTRVMTNLHRSLLAGDVGQAASAIGAAAMLLLTVSGLWLLARRLGGWWALLRPIRGTAAQRWHSELGRCAVVGLILSSLTGLWMSAGTLGLIPESGVAEPAFTVNGGLPAPVGTLAALRAVDVTDLRELTLPVPTDRTDTYGLRTSAGEARIDAATGEVLAFTPTPLLERIQNIVIMLHTGRGAWVLGLLLGFSAACVPAFAVTGAAIWWRRRASRPRIADNVAARSADTVILVGSEGNATWGFATTLHAALTAAGHRVHIAAMSELAPVHASVERMLILTSTYGDGAAPASAKGFLDRLTALDIAVPVAVLGFGDRTFPHFCGYAQEVAAALDRKGWLRLLPLKRVDRQSTQEFAQWGRDLGSILGHDLVLDHIAAHPKTTELQLVEREDYGTAVGAPVAILRFRVPGARAKSQTGCLPAFEAGDLVGIVPPGSPMPRFYSLASSSRDGVLEICVRLQEGGLCSAFLHDLEPGGSIDAFIRENPSFRPAEGRTPLILIGAGAGIGPLAGFVRANDAGRPVHLYWGGRSPSSDFLYEHELAMHLAEKRLTTPNTAFSRTPDGGAYVQDRIAADAPRLRELIRHGAQVLVCGGRDMAQAVTHALDAVVRPLGLDLATLKSSGRYIEDVY